MRLGIVGGSGADFFPTGGAAELTAPESRWGKCSGPVLLRNQAGHEVLFVARHGPAGSIAPHRINYRANLQALKDLGAKQVIGLNAVGGIRPDVGPGQLVLPDQLIDYTWGREHTIYDDEADELLFIDFTKPYDEKLRNYLALAARTQGLDVVAQATYGATQGPRLETAAEITRLERDGCDIVGMTGMPEAALARELDLPYASICFVVKWAAGKAVGDIHADIPQYLSAGVSRSARLIDGYLGALQ